MGSPGYKAELAVGAGNTVVAKCQNAELTIDGAVIDVTTRASAGWKENDAGMREWGLSGQQLWVPDDAALELIEAAIMNGTKLAVRILDVTGALGHGWSGTGVVTKLGRSEPLDGALVCPFELKGDGPLVRIDPI